MITYGLESRLKGGEEPENRKSFPWNSPTPLHSTIKKLRDLRVKYPVLERGEGEIVELDEGLLVFRQSLGEMHSYIAINQGSRDVEISLPEGTTVLEVFGESNSLQQKRKTTVMPAATKLIIAELAMS